MNLFFSVFSIIAMSSGALAAEPSALYPFEKKMRWGYINNSGTVVIDPQFRFARAFVGGMAAVQDYSGLWWFIDQTGKLLFNGGLPTEPRDFAEGLLASRSSTGPQSKWGYCDKNGEFVIRPKFDSAQDFSEGLAAVFTESRWIYVDHTGKQVWPGGFDAAKPFREGLAGVKVGGQFGFVNRSGLLVITPDFASVGDFSGGLAAVAMSGNSLKWGYIDTKGSVVIPFQFRSAGPFSEGLASVQTPGSSFEEWEYIGTSGKIAITKKFRDAHQFSQGLAAVMTGEAWDRYSYIDKSGTIKIPPRFVMAGEFSVDGVARVSIPQNGPGPQPASGHGETWNGYIQRSGRVIWSFTALP